MTIALLLLALVALATFGVLAIATFVSHDGNGHPAGHTPPRSHLPDTFEPRRLV